MTYGAISSVTRRVLSSHDSISNTENARQFYFYAKPFVTLGNKNIKITALVNNVRYIRLERCAFDYLLPGVSASDDAQISNAVDMKDHQIFMYYKNIHGVTVLSGGGGGGG